MRRPPVVLAALKFGKEFEFGFSTVGVQQRACC